VSDRRYGVTSLLDLGTPVGLAEVDMALRQTFDGLFGSTAPARVPEKREPVCAEDKGKPT
jgi:lipoyl(octanoyl) transferase